MPRASSKYTVYQLPSFLFLCVNVFILNVHALPLSTSAGTLPSRVVVTTTLATGPGHRRQLSPNPLSPITSTPTTSSPSSASISDGGGIGYAPVSILWIVFSILLALPLLVAGVRGYKFTSGTGTGLALALLIWVTFVNSTSSGTTLASSQNTSDLFLSLVVWGVFMVGCLASFVRVGVLVGINLLGACAGVALGILMVLLRPGLLIPIYAINIIPIALLGTAGLLWPLWHQRLAVIVSTSTIGAFFLSLSIDLSLNKQSGLSAGLRFLLDRNKNHRTITLQSGYHPPLSTIIIIGTCIALIPAFSYLQHRLWKGPFDRSEKSLEEWNILVNGAPILGPGDEGFVSKDAKMSEEKKPKVRFPSIIPSLPGNVPAPLPTKGNKGRITAGVKGGVEIGGVVSPVYLAQQAAFQANPPMPMQNIPGPGVGRSGFVGYWTGVGSTIAKRVSRRFSGGVGVAKRFSQMSAPSVYSIDQNAAGTSVPARGWGWRPQQQQQQGYQTQQSYQQSNARYTPNRDDTPGSVYGGVQVPQTRPLQLPSRVTPVTSNSRAPPSTYANSNYAPSSYAPSVKTKAQPAPSLRTGRFNDVPIPQRPGPSSSSAQRQPNSASTRQQVILPSQQASQSRPQQQQSPSRSQYQAQSPPGNRNKLKPSTRHNLL